jgi:hypothetical protein
VGIVVGCDDDAGDLKLSTVQRPRGAMNLATLGRCLRSRLTEPLQRTTLAGSVFCLLVDGARTIVEVPASATS